MLELKRSTVSVAQGIRQNLDNHLLVDVVRKDIKNLHLGVYPPNGRVRVAAPLAVNDDAVRLAVIGKLGWIRRQKAKFEAQARQSPREMVDGESHYYLGRRYRLTVVEAWGRQTVSLKGGTRIVIQVHPGANAAARWRVLEHWYREQLRHELKPLVEHWVTWLSLEVPEWRIRWMRTQWGSCSAAGRVWFNLGLIKKPPQCIEYVVVHELAHLLERGHGDRFVELLDEHLPDWRQRREELNANPLISGSGLGGSV